MGFFVIFLIVGISVRESAPDEVMLFWEDYLIKIFAGTQEIRQMERASSFYIPKEWLIVEFLFFILIAKYPKKDLEEQGIQVLLRTRSKGVWWLSKCIWLICSGVLYYGVFYLAMIVNAIVDNPMTGLHIKIRDIWQIGLEGCSQMEVNMILFVMPLLCSLAIGMVQMLLSIAFSPVLALCVSIAYQVLAVAVQKSWILGNYTMLCRHEPIYVNGVRDWKGILFSTGIFFIGIFLGMKHMKKKEFF